MWTFDGTFSVFAGLAGDGLKWFPAAARGRRHRAQNFISTRHGVKDARADDDA
jgi:hypothetical protein